MFDSNPLKVAFFKKLVGNDRREDSEGCGLVAVVRYMARFPRPPRSSLALSWRFKHLLAEARCRLESWCLVAVPVRRKVPAQTFSL